MPKFIASRRQVLKAAGVAITLPYLESLVPASARAQTTPAAAPSRFIGMIHPQGFPLLDYNNNSRGTILYPTNTGTFTGTMPTCLVPLTTRGVANEVFLIGGLKHDADPASVTGAHTQYTAGRVLVGKNIDSSDQANKISSLDCAIHQKIGGKASLSTQRMTLGMAGRFLNNQGSPLTDADYVTDSNGKRTFLNAAGETAFGAENNMQESGSYLNGVTQTSINNPRLAFNKLFCNGNTTCPGGGTIGGMGATPPPVDKTLAPRQSVLHYVADRIKKLQTSRQLGTADGQKLDQYLTGINDIETRLTAMETPPTMMGRTISIPSRDLFQSIPSSQDALGRLMVDLIVKAFEANLMNVGTIMMGATDGANINPATVLDSTLWNIGTNASSHDHYSSHNDFTAATKISTNKVDVFAYLIQQLKATSDTTGMLLDNTLVYYSSDFGSGHQHDVTNVPVMLAGRFPSIVRAGTYALHADTPAVRVMVSVAAQFGVTLPQANGQTGVL